VNPLAAPLVALVGPTASGKSALAHAVALERGGVEILSVDAMGVYRGMDIGTAKPTRAQREAVTYHLIDLVAASEEFTVAQYQAAARAAKSLVEGRGHAVLYVGGTGLYARAVIDDLDIPGRYPEVRRELEERAAKNLGPLYDELVVLDPVAAGRLEASNARRVVRALEVTLGSKRPFSSYGEGLLRYGPSSVIQVGVDVEPELLDASIERRFLEWMDLGLLEEVARLACAPGGLSRSARQAVGYKELLGHLEDGQPLEECVQRAISHSRRLARRQRSWFHRDPRIEWFDDVDLAGARVREVLSGPNAFVRD